MKQTQTLVVQENLPFSQLLGLEPGPVSDKFVDKPQGLMDGLRTNVIHLF
jgi:hypothetical protein